MLPPLFKGRALRFLYYYSVYVNLFNELFLSLSFFERSACKGNAFFVNAKTFHDLFSKKVLFYAIVDLCQGIRD